MIFRSFASTALMSDNCVKAHILFAGLFIYFAVLDVSYYSLINLLAACSRAKESVCLHTRQQE